MSVDLGLRPEDVGNVLAIAEHVKFVERQFDLVMIAERIDESVVLLRHLLGLSLEDVLFFKHNKAARETGESRFSLKGLNTEEVLQEMVLMSCNIYSGSTL